MSNGAGELRSWVPPDWRRLLEKEFEKPYWAKLEDLVRTNDPKGVYPPREQIFAALELTPYAETKVVIVGQDPYPGRGQAHGLAFSVPAGVRPPPTLRNILREVQEDGWSTDSVHGSLERWARQGVLLLNRTLTVDAGKRRSHRGRGWERFTEAVVGIVDGKDLPVLFMLWGCDAQELERLVHRPHKVIRSSHPSPIAAYRWSCHSPPFRESRPFSKANYWLRGAGQGEIDWRLAD